MERTASQLLSLTTSDRQRLILGVMILPLAASCVLVTSFALARVVHAQGSDNTRVSEVRLLVTERDRRVEGADFVQEDDVRQPGDAGERLVDPPPTGFSSITPASHAGRRVPGSCGEANHLVISPVPSGSIIPRAPPARGDIG